MGKKEGGGARRRRRRGKRRKEENEEQEEEEETAKAVWTAAAEYATESVCAQRRYSFPQKGYLT